MVYLYNMPQHAFQPTFLFSTSIVRDNDFQCAPSAWQGFRGERRVLWAYECRPAETGEHDAGGPGGGNPHLTSTFLSVTRFGTCAACVASIDLCAVFQPTTVTALTSTDRRTRLSGALKGLEAQLWQTAVGGCVQFLLLPELQRCFYMHA